MAIFLAVYYVNKLNFQYQTFFTSQDNKQLVLCIYIFRERERETHTQRQRDREREREGEISDVSRPFESLVY